MASGEDNEEIHQGWLELSVATKKTRGSWLKKSTSKQWKWRYVVLLRPIEGSEQVTLAMYDKEENKGNQPPKKSVDMYPRYKVAKKEDFKGRSHVFEVANDEESCYFAADSQKSMDLWVIQVQMQTKLSRTISGRIFSVMPCKTRPLQRIGARDQRCLLHFTRWGLTLALQNSRAILAMWPLSTIRNYECTGSGYFTFEAGRKAPMGTGLYSFGVLPGDDDQMFNVIDAFVSARLNARAELSSKRREEENTDEEVLATYDKLHACALGFLPHDVTPGLDDYALIGPPLPSDPEYLANPPPSYDHLASSGLIRTSSEASNQIEDDNASCPPDSRHASFSDTTNQSYDRLMRSPSWGSTIKADQGASSYDRLSRGNGVAKSQDSYDHIDWVAPTGPARFLSQQSFGSLSQQDNPKSPPVATFQEASKRGPSVGMHQAPSGSDAYVYTNTIYASESAFKPKSSDSGTSPSFHNSVKQKRSSSAGKRQDAMELNGPQEICEEIYVPQTYPLTTPLLGQYQNAGTLQATTIENGDRKSLLSQEIESNEDVDYQNVSVMEPATSAGSSPLLPSRSADTVRFVPASGS